MVCGFCLAGFPGLVSSRAPALLRVLQRFEIAFAGCACTAPCVLSDVCPCWFVVVVCVVGLW